MSHSGYSGDNSSSSSSPSGSPLSPMSSSLTPWARVAPTTPGIDNFLYGRHSFHSANELQFYLERMGGPGSIVNITDVAHFPVLQPTSQQSQGSNSGGIARRALGNSENDWRNGSPPSPLGPISQSSGSSISSQGSQQPVPPGYTRSNYFVFCELHRTSAGVPPSPSPSPDGPYGRRFGNVIFVGHCAICQAITVEDVRGQSIL